MNTNKENNVEIFVFDVDWNISKMNKTEIPYAIKEANWQLARALTYPMESIELKKDPDNVFYDNYEEDEKNNEYHFRNCFDEWEWWFWTWNFAKDVLESDKLPEYEKLISSIENASPILILTARWHRSDSLKKWIFDIIQTTDGLKNKCIASIKKKYGFSWNEDDIINQYLDHKCMFVAVYSPEFDDEFDPMQWTWSRKKIVVKKFIDKFIQDHKVLCVISDDEEPNIKKLELLSDELSKNEQYKNLKIDLIHTGNNSLS